MPIERMLELAKRLVDLLEDPQPGLITWNMALAHVLDQLREQETPDPSTED